MAERDPNRVQLDFPQLVADLIRQLRLTGTVGLLELTDQVTPVYIVAQRAGALSITTSPPIFSSASLFAAQSNNPGINTIVLDTGPLPAGDYDVYAHISASGRATTIGSAVVIEHRDAANAVNLAILLNAPWGLVEAYSHSTLAPIRYTLALNERLRVVAQQAFTGQVAGSLGIVIVPTP